MSWTSKVAWKEGLFLQPQHLQQADRYLESLIQSRTANITPYPFGLSELTFDKDMARQGKIGLRAAYGLFPDGTPFDAPGRDDLPLPVAVPEEATGLSIWLTLPDKAVNGREIGAGDDAAARYKLAPQGVIDNASAGGLEQMVEVAVPRLEIALRKTARAGYQCLRIGRVIEVRDGVVTIDDTVPPTGLILDVHPAFQGYLTRVIGWIEAKLEGLARYAADASSGGGLQATDFLQLMVLNRELPVLRHLRDSGAVHPERLYEKLIGLAGELSTFDQGERHAPEYEKYDHTDPKAAFTPVVQDIQRLLARDVGRAVRLELREVRPNSFAAIVNDRSLFAQASFVVEVSSKLPLTQIQQQFPQLCKVGPSTRMKQIITNNLPGIGLVHLPNPPRQIRVVSSNVYFLLDKSTELWQEFTNAPAIGMQLSGDWPDLGLEMWAIPERA